MFSNKIILLLSSSPVTLRFFQSFERDMEDYTVKVAQTLEKAQDLLSRVKFDVIVIDAKSPFIDLKASLEAINQDPDYTFTAILMISEGLKKAFIRQMLQLGVTDFLAEPFEVHECQIRIEMAIQTEANKKKMQNLHPEKFLPKAEINAPMPQVKKTSSCLIEALKRSKQNKSPLALLCVHIEGHVLEVEKILTSEMRRHDTLIRKSEQKILVILENTSFRASGFIAENLLEVLESRCNDQTKIGIGGSFLEKTFLEKKVLEIALSIEKESIEKAQEALAKGSVVISKLHF